MKRTHRYASIASAGALACAVVALAQTPPPDSRNPNPQQPRPQQPNERPGQQPGMGGAHAGYMETPRYAQRLDTTLTENAVQICKEKDFKGDQSTIENAIKSHRTGTLNELPANFDNDVTSIRWNLAPGVLMVLFDDAAGKGVQLALWGKGQIADLNTCNFNDSTSRWAWYDVGGGIEPRSAGNIEQPYGSQAVSGSLTEGTIQIYDDQKFEGTAKTIAIMQSKAGDLNKMPDTENTASSVRWNLPEGVIAIFSAKDDGTNSVVVFGEGQYPDLGVCGFDNRASRWSWAYIGSGSKDHGDQPGREPGREPDTNRPRP